MPSVKPVAATEGGAGPDVPPQGSGDGAAPPLADECPLELKAAGHLVGIVVNNADRRIERGEQDAVRLPSSAEVRAAMVEGGLDVPVEKAGCTGQIFTDSDGLTQIINCTGEVEKGVYVNYDYVFNHRSREFDLQTVSRVHHEEEEPYIVACKQLENDQQIVRRFYPGRLAKPSLFDALKRELDKVTVNAAPTREAAVDAATRLQSRMMEIAQRTLLPHGHGPETLIPHVAIVNTTLKSYNPRGAAAPVESWRQDTDLRVVYRLGTVTLTLSLGSPRTLETAQTQLFFSQPGNFPQRTLEPSMSPEDLPVFTPDSDESARMTTSS